MFYFQTERAFQKQAPIFQNKKRILGQQGKKDKKELRYVRNVGLGFKTPKEVMCHNFFLVDHLFIDWFTYGVYVVYFKTLMSVSAIHCNWS